MERLDAVCLQPQLFISPNSTLVKKRDALLELYKKENQQAGTTLCCMTFMVQYLL